MGTSLFVRFPPPSNSSKYVSSVCNTAVLIPTSPIASVTPPCCFQRSVRILGVTNERVLYRSTISAEGNDVSRVRSNTDRKGLCDQTVRVSVTMCASISRRSLARRESYNVLAIHTFIRHKGRQMKEKETIYKHTDRQTDRQTMSYAIHVTNIFQ